MRGILPGLSGFLSEAKTERECVEFMEARIQAAGYRPLEEYIAAGKRLRQGDKVYRVNMKKGIVLSISAAMSWKTA